ncbi:hypothetical protein KM043_005506 [Ampulex compressa]|nr:hypothetical protein KM043_005506 [Ampulex compressa]
MIHFKISAPGKVILYGEHAVVYGKTAVAASLGLRTTVEFLELPETEGLIKISFPKVHIAVSVPVQQLEQFFFKSRRVKLEDDGNTFYNVVEEFVRAIGYNNSQQKLSLEAFFYLLLYIMQKEHGQIKPFQLHLSTELSIRSGLGSSASFAVCLAACFRYWSQLQKNVYKAFDSEDLDIISAYALKCEKIIHGTPSGIDNSICTYGSMIEYRKNESINVIPDIRSMKILLVDTRVGRSTKVLVEQLAALKNTYPEIMDPILNSIDNISKEAVKILKKISEIPIINNESHLEEYNELMMLINLNQGLLATCQVSHPSLDRICAEARNYNLAAKLTGAGGGGYAYILLLPDTQPETISSISRKLIADGFSITLTTLGCAGVQIHE